MSELVSDAPYEMQVRVFSPSTPQCGHDATPSGQRIASKWARAASSSVKILSVRFVMTSIRSVMSEMASLAERSIQARGVLRSFLDQQRVVGCFEIDEPATAVAGHVIFRDEPSQELVCVLAAMRAADEVARCMARVSRF